MLISGKGQTDKTDKIIPETMKLLDMIDFRETNLTDSVNKINSVIREVNSVVDWVKTSIIKGNKSDEETWTQKYSTLLEYILLYIIATLSVASALGFFVLGKTDWASVGIIATVMLSTILLGTAKYILGRLIQRKSMKIESLEETNKALETALSAQSMERVKERSQFQKLYEHVKMIDPNFDIGKLFMETMPTEPQRIEPLSITKFCDDQVEYEKRKKMSK